MLAAATPREGCRWDWGEVCGFPGFERRISERVCSECARRNRDPEEVKRELKVKSLLSAEKASETCAKQDETRCSEAVPQSQPTRSFDEDVPWCLLATEVFSEPLVCGGGTVLEPDPDETVFEFVISERVARVSGSVKAMVPSLRRWFPRILDNTIIAKIGQIRKKAGVNSAKGRSAGVQGKLKGRAPAELPGKMGISCDVLAEEFFSPEFSGSVAPFGGRTIGAYVVASDVGDVYCATKRIIEYVAAHCDVADLTARNWLNQLRRAALANEQ
ncbi:MAG: hypothetical protein Q8M92_11045, partial [Candidatus Subteraquimicrobiales bacterium]|nr:hypothetical protein [Candidatus Subteraquimicrobiales bacterium]